MCLEIITKYLGFIRPPEGLNCNIKTLQQHLSPDIILIHKCLVDGLYFFLTKKTMHVKLVVLSDKQMYSRGLTIDFLDVCLNYITQ